MYNPIKPFERELNFTRAYKESINLDKATRELNCLKEQIPQSFRPFRNDSEILVGRIDNALVGFHPSFEGKNSCDVLGYCINQDKCFDLLEKVGSTLKKEEVSEIKTMIEFWRTESTTYKTRKKMTDKMLQSMTGDNYNAEIGACYPLYRIAGIHLDAEKLFNYGLNGLIALIESKKVSKKDSTNLYDAMIGSLELIKDTIQLYIEYISDEIKKCKNEDRTQELNTILQSLITIKDNKPQTLQQAIQLLTIYMLATNTREMGRLDIYFGDFYANDIDNNLITHEYAVRLVVNFFDIIEQELARDTRAIIGGKGRKNESNADKFSFVVLDALDLRPFSFQPQVSLRYYKGMNEDLLNKSLEILEKGVTFPILYNDDANVDAVMKAMKVDKSLAEQYAFFGCGEYMIDHKSIGTPNAVINVAKILELVFNNGLDPITGKNIGLGTGICDDSTTYEQIVERFQKQIDYFADLAGDFKELVYDMCNEEASFLLISTLYDDCINRGKAMFDGGIEHLGGTVETYGNITVTDSLTAIKDVVFNKKAFGITKLVEMLQDNFVGFEKEQKMLLDAPKYGNDNDFADDTAVEINKVICNAIRRQSERTRMDSVLVVIINNSMNVYMGECTGATPDGRKARLYLSNANSAYNGCDKEGITALMKSMTKLDTTIHAGSTQNFKFSPAMFADKTRMKMLIGGFFALGGSQTSMTVVNQADLEDAMIHPENHENLVVRVGGYTARFNELNMQTKKDILERTAY